MVGLSGLSEMPKPGPCCGVSSQGAKGPTSALDGQQPRDFAKAVFRPVDLI
jgi:hypothetical protein